MFYLDWPFPAPLILYLLLLKSTLLLSHMWLIHFVLNAQTLFLQIRHFHLYLFIFIVVLHRFVSLLTFHNPALNVTLPAAPESSSGSLRMLRASSTRCGTDSDAETRISRFSAEMVGPECAAASMSVICRRSVCIPSSAAHKVAEVGMRGVAWGRRGGGGVDAALSIAGSLWWSSSN